MRTQKGFSLIELMIAVAIIGVLASIAVPSYNEYLIRARIADATSGLSSKRVQMEQWFQDNRTYATTADAGGLCVASDSTTSQYFTFSCSPAPTIDTFTLQAVGTGPMSGFTYTVTQANAKATTVTGVSGWSGNASCWVTRKGGAC